MKFENKEVVILNSLIKPCPIPNELGLLIDEKRVEEYDRLLHLIKGQYEGYIFMLLILFFICVWGLGVELVIKIHFEEAFYKDVLGNIVTFIWGWFLYKMLREFYLIERCCNILTKWEFNRINNKTKSFENITINGQEIFVKKFTKEEILQINLYKSFKRDYISARLKAEDIIKRSLVK